MSENFPQESVPAEEIPENEIQKEGTPVLEYETPPVLDEKAGFLEKHPKFKERMLIFAAIAGGFLARYALNNNTPTLKSQVQGTKSEIMIDDIDEALEKISDGEFKDEVGQAMKDIENFKPTVPQNVRYAVRQYIQTLNDGTRIKKETEGELPENAQDVVVGVNDLMRNVTKSTIGEKGNSLNDYVGQAESFYIAGTENGSEIETAGTMTHSGEGYTKESALINAIQAAVNFTGENISSQNSLEKKIKAGAKESDFSGKTKTGGTIETGSRQAIKGYKIIKHDIEPREDSNPTHRIEIEVQYGVEKQAK